MINLFLIAIESNASWMVALGATLAFVLFVYRAKMRHYSRRAEELEIAKNAIQAHYKAVQAVLNSPIPSPELKSSLCSFSDAVTDREFGLMLAHMAQEGSLFERKLSPEFQKINDERAEIEKTNSDLKRFFHTAVEAGIVSAFTRWPETARYFTMVTAELASDDRKEMQIAQKAKAFFDGTSGDNGNRGVLIPV